MAKRLNSIARARSFVNWQNRKPLVTDLESQLRAIREQIAPDDPAEALSLLWRLMQVATPLFERCDESSFSSADQCRRRAEPVITSMR